MNPAGCMKALRLLQRNCMKALRLPISNRRGMLLTVSAFFIMISFVALFALMQSQQNSIYGEMTQLSSIDSTVSCYNSVEHAIQNILNKTWSADINSSSSADVVSIYAGVPVTVPSEKVQHFADFVSNQSRFNISSSFDFSEINLAPTSIAAKYSANSITTEPKNTNASLGQLKGYSVIIYWDGSTKPITSSLSSSSTGIDVSVYLYATKGQTLREFHGKVDPNLNSAITLELYPNLNQTAGGKTVNITVSSPGELAINYASGLSFGLQEQITLIHNDSLKVNYKKAELLVNNTDFGVSKQGEVGT